MVQVYKRPLQRKLQENAPVLDRDQIQSLFGPIRLIQNQHELFYAAISEETKDWSPDTQIGGVFLASVYALYDQSYVFYFFYYDSPLGKLWM